MQSKKIWPLAIESMRSRVLVGCGASRGPTTKEGFTTTRSFPVSSANFQASFSATVFAYAYQSCVEMEARMTTKECKQQSFGNCQIYTSRRNVRWELESSANYMVVFAVFRITPMRLIERRHLLNIISVSYWRAGRCEHNPSHTSWFCTWF